MVCCSMCGLFSTLMQETVDAGDAERVTTQSSTTRKRRVSIAKVVLPSCAYCVLLQLLLNPLKLVDHALRPANQ
jgi:hypothetical protein